MSSVLVLPVRKHQRQSSAGFAVGVAYLIVYLLVAVVSIASWPGIAQCPNSVLKVLQKAKVVSEATHLKGTILLLSSSTSCGGKIFLKYLEEMEINGKGFNQYIEKYLTSCFYKDVIHGKE